MDITDETVDITDETFVVAERSVLATHFADPGSWRSWWPDLDLSVVADRGDDGIRWEVHGRLSGTAEIWLEPWHDGVIVHWFVRAQPESAAAASLRDHMIRAHKARIHRLKDELERTRAPGMPRFEPTGNLPANELRV